MRRRHRGPVTYADFRQRVRRFRQSDVLLAVASLNATFLEAELADAPPPAFPNFVQPFALAGVARTALMAGSEARDRHLDLRDVVEMCDYYANVEEPGLSDEPGVDRLRRVLNHHAYEQFSSQYSVMENIGRTLALFHDHVVDDAPTPDAWKEALGVSLDHFMRIGLGLHTVAMRNRGVVPAAFFDSPEATVIMHPLTAAEAWAVVNKWFAGSPEELRALGEIEQELGFEKWSLNPLVTKPLVAMPRGEMVVPWPRLLLDRITPTGLYFIGLAKFGSTFTDSLGFMFERYVGAQLSTLTHASVEPEIVYGKDGELSVDYFVITEEVVVLVEVKTARPVRSTRLGQPSGDDDTARKVNKAFSQIERSTQLIAEGHPAFAEIPVDRPLRGLVVTLEPFHLVNSQFYDNILHRPSVPTAVASSHELENAVAALRDSPDIGTKLLDALNGEDGPPSLDCATSGLVVPANAMVDGAWDRFTEPWAALRKKLDEPA